MQSSDGKQACPTDGSQLSDITLAGVHGKVCLKCGNFTTDASLTPEQYVRVLEAYNQSRGLEKDREYKLTLVGPSQMGALTVPEHDLSQRHKHCLSCGFEFFPPKNKPSEIFCSQACASQGWGKQYPPAGMRPSFTQPMPIIPAR